MKKILFLALCAIIGASSLTAGKFTTRGFDFMVPDNDDSSDKVSLIGITDEQYDLICRTHTFVCPAQIEYKGKLYQVTTIAKNLFENRSTDKIHLILISDQLESMGEMVVSGMENLQEIRFGESVTNMGSCNFNGLPSLKELTFPEVDHISYGEFSFCGLGVECINFPTIHTRGSIHVGFCSLPNLVELNLGGLEYLGYHSFSDLPKLEEVTFTADQISFGGDNFKNLPLLKKITFKNRNGQAIWLGHDHFVNCPMFKDVYVEDIEPVKLNYIPQSSGFNPSMLTLHVPVGTRDAYASEPGWQDFGTIVEGDMSEIDTAVADSDAWSCINIAGGIVVRSCYSDLKVVSAAGTVVATITASSDSTTVSLPAGIYIVSDGSRTVKVCVK